MTQSDIRPRLIGYLRVSSEEQAREGVSLEAQEDRIRAYVIAQDAELLGIERDNGTSGKTPPAKRAGLSRALQAVRDGEADGIVALRLDRISRSVRDVLDLAEDAERCGWRLVAVNEALDTGTPTGRFTLTILAALAQLEREQIAARTRETLGQVAREGRVRSHRLPFGWRTPRGAITGQKGAREVLVTPPGGAAATRPNPRASYGRIRCPSHRAGPQRRRREESEDPGSVVQGHRREHPSHGEAPLRGRCS